MKKCEKCGAENTDTLAFCTNCGAPLLSNPAPAPEPAAPAVPEAPIPEANPVAPAETPAVPAPEPMPAPTVESTTPVNPAPSTIPTPTPVTEPAAPTAAKNDNNKLLMIILIAVVAVIGIVVAVVMIIANSGSGSTTSTTTTSTSNNIETEDTDVVTSSTSDGTNIIVGEYQLTIPKAYDYEVKDNALYLGDATQTWAASIVYNADVPHELVAANLDALMEEVNKIEGATALSSGTDAINGIEYPFIDYNLNGYIVTMGFFGAPNGSSFIVEATDGTAVANHSIFGYVTPVLATAQETVASKEMNFIKIGNGLITNTNAEIINTIEKE